MSSYGTTLSYTFLSVELLLIIIIRHVYSNKWLHQHSSSPLSIAISTYAIEPEVCISFSKTNIPYNRSIDCHRKSLINLAQLEQGNLQDLTNLDHTGGINVYFLEASWSSAKSQRTKPTKWSRFCPAGIIFVAMSAGLSLVATCPVRISSIAAASRMKW